MLRTEAKTKTDNGEQGVIVVLRILQSMKRRNMMIDGLIPRHGLATNSFTRQQRILTTCTPHLCIYWFSLTV
jgi:hypothetical protein